jgi:hypothetical protein
MSIVRSVFLVCTLFTTCSSLLCQQRPNPHQRDPVLVEVLTRVVNAAGGAQTLAAVHDLTESGEITFHWGEGVKGPLVIQSLGGNHFRMEADLPEGKTTWVVKDGNGTKREANQKARQLSGENAINFGGLTFPLAHLVTALADAGTDVALMRIEKREGHSVYRVRIKGQLGLVRNISPVSVTKDVLIDALNFGIVSVEDYPYPVYQRNGKLADSPPRAIEYGDFRVVDGVRVPFSIDTKLQGQPVMSIRLTKVTFNNHLIDGDFKE